LYYKMLIFLMMLLIEFIELCSYTVLDSMSSSRSAYNILRRNTPLLHPYGRSFQFSWSIAAELITGCSFLRFKKKMKGKWRL
jgi:hypothetical protein